MDPRIAWCTPEQLGSAHDQWSRLWEIQLGVRNLQLNYSPNMDRKDIEFIPLDSHNQWDHKQGQGLNNKQQNYQNQHFLKRKRENKASTFGLNHSSCVHHLGEDGGLTPWKPRDKIYSSTGVVGSVFYHIFDDTICLSKCDFGLCSNKERISHLIVNSKS